MTMADTIAVMNGGHIEQLGNPVELYESPATVFVANFLGQSNLIVGKKSGNSGDDLLVSAYGLTFAMPADRCFAPGENIIVGVRPEKITVLDLVDQERIPAHHNRITGRVTDVSYTGVSTQYLVMTPWDQELSIFEQNSVVGDRCEVGDQVIFHWSPRHTFGLDGSSSVTAGVDPDVLEVEAAAAALAAAESDD